jgi:quercetin dioxygenase-like cupin family protein
MNTDERQDRMKIIDLSTLRTCEQGRYVTSVLFEQGAVKVRRIELAAGARISPCRMQEDVVFVVIEGRVAFRAEDKEAVVNASGAVFIQGGATTRSMEADEASLVLAVLCRHEAADPAKERPESKA